MKNQKIIGFTSGYFDIMHPGHVLMLDECKMYCDYLIVGVHSFITQTPQPDGRKKNQPIWTADERLMMEQSSKYVDKAFLYDGEEELYKYLKENQNLINVRILGEDHKDKPFTGDDLKINIVFNTRRHNYSTTNTIKKIIEERT